MYGESWYNKGRAIFTSIDLKGGLQTILPPLVISLTLPTATLIYLLLISSIPLLRGPFWIPENIGLLCSILYGGSIPTTFYYLVKEEGIPKQLYDYISELTSSVLVLTVSLCLILTEMGAEPFEQTGGYSGVITGSMARILLLIMFITLGILFANMHFVYPKLKSTIKSTISWLKSKFIPPYTDPDFSIKPFNQPELNQNESRHW